MFGNPAGLVVLLGKVARLCDDGHEVSKYIQILYQCSSPQESESTNMKIHVDKAFPSEPSQILYLSYDSVNTSLRNDFTDILALMDVEQDHRNSGNPNYIMCPVLLCFSLVGSDDTRVQCCKGIMVQTKQVST